MCTFTLLCAYACALENNGIYRRYAYVQDSGRVMHVEMICMAKYRMYAIAHVCMQDR